MSENGSWSDSSIVAPADDSVSDHQDSLVVDPSDSLTRLFALLSNEEHRQILYVLLRHDDTTISVSRLTHEVRDISDSDDGFMQTRERLVRTHLPQLSFVGIVDYNLAGDSYVWLSPNAEIVDEELLTDIVERTFRYER